MKFIADENVLDGMVEFLRSKGHQVVNVKRTALAGSTDDEIYEIAVKENNVILSMDKDFTRLLRFPPDMCGGIIVCKLYKMPVRQAVDIFGKIFNTLSNDDIDSNLVVITRSGTSIKKVKNDKTG